VVGGACGYDVTRRLYDVSDEARGVGEARLLMFALFAPFVSAQLL